ncbi:NACHT, LRR and PYD domains-containing protein 3-like isoform X2 [Paramisgurnus dabryanus]|uniref:NACHT, LRR and PYD domains-containing protein 3-like isoform X2 n=1 Tax=Paramisgurnus dabryanus TaxID=90735 RepID=UPI003CCEFBA7
MSLYEERKDGVQYHKTQCSELSCVSLKSKESIVQPPNLNNGAMTSDPIEEKDYTSNSVKSHLTCTALMETFFRQQRLKHTHKSILKNKYESLFEGIKLQKNKTLLNRIYTQLYIIEGESGGVNEEHEVLQMEKTPRTQQLQETRIYCNDIFKPLPESEYKTERRREKKTKIKSVLTQGITGIGKTVSVQKFILDWAEGKNNQDIDFMFVLPFRELNLIQDDQYSLHKLLLDFHPELQDLDSKVYGECKVVFIFDGLDESRITLMFSHNEKVSDVTQASSVGVLMSNLIKGDLLPSAHIWITSRPAAASQIPSKYINRLTEIQGFNDPQKEEYFRKRISNEHQASRIISHIKKTRSLHIMCHIPVFCWISSTVLQNILKQDHTTEIPKTLTEMYIHFLLIQMNMKNEKYDERDPQKLLQSNREMIVKLSELAFKQLMKGNVMFYEEDLRDCGIDITDASVYSGICTGIFKEESVIHQRKIYCFIHLSFQEFLAAFYVFYSHLTKNTESLHLFLVYEYESYKSEDSSLFQLLTSAVHKSLGYENGHLDLFLRFLLGISLELNQRLLQDLLPHTEGSSKSIKKTTNYIIDKINDEYCLLSNRYINLLFCLLEMKVQSLHRQIQECLPSQTLSAAHCSAIAYIIQMSEEVLDELDLKKYNTTQEGRKRLVPAVINCRKALLANCSLTDECCESLVSALESFNSPLRELDLSYNNLKDFRVNSIKYQLGNLRLKLLFNGRKNPNCKLEILRLSSCNLTDHSCEVLASALKSSNSSLKELDLSNNDLQDLGVKLISEGLKSTKCQLEILRLSGCMVTEESCIALALALRSNPSHLRELDVSYNHPGDSGIKLLSDVLEDPHYKLEILNVAHAGEIMITAGPRKYACDLTLDPNTVNPHLRLSEMNRKVTRLEKERESYPDHPERFDYWPQVMCKEILTEHCYWEVEWSGWRGAVISVMGKEISRRGADDGCRFGFNEKSWSLDCSDNIFTVWHNKNSIDVDSPLIASKRVGVYLDCPAGTLSFYSVSKKLTHLHTFNFTFTEPLCAGFRIYSDSSVSLCCTKQPSNKTHKGPDL